MARKEFTYKGKTIEELKNMSLKELAGVFPARQRRSLTRGFTPQQKILMKKIEKKEDHIKTHCRDMVIVPSMLGAMIHVYNGKVFVPVIVQEDMISHYLGEFVLTRKKVEHSAPGIGATRSSDALSVK